LATGHVNVDQMLDSITSEQFAEWVAFYRCEPFGEGWMQTSYICSMMVNILASSRADQVNLDHFLPEFAQQKPQKMTVADDEAEMAALFGK
jgi:hypothetical protein